MSATLMVTMLAALSLAQAQPGQPDQGQRRMTIRQGLFQYALNMMGPPAQATQPAGDAPKGPALRKGDLIVAIGDSITQAGGYLELMNAVFRQQYPELELPPIVNVGISGQKAEDLVARFQKDVLDRKPQVVTISIGINDVWHRLKEPHDPKVLEAYTENVEKMVKSAREAGAQVYLLSPTVIEEDPASEGNQRLTLYIDAGKKIARRNDVRYVDLHRYFLRVSSRHTDRPRGTTQPFRMLTTDGVHMKPLGDAVMAAGVLREMGVPDEKIRATDVSDVLPRRQPANRPQSRPRP